MQKNKPKDEAKNGKKAKTQVKTEPVKTKNSSPTPKKNVKAIKPPTPIDVKPELFNEMITNEGTSISDLNDKGYRVLLFFTSYIGDLHSKGTMYDIYKLQGEFLKMNCIPVIVHQESNETYGKFLRSTPQKNIFTGILHMERKNFGKKFNVKENTTMEDAYDFFSRGYKEASRLMKLGFKNEFKYLPKEDSSVILSAVFVVQEKKVVFEYRKENKYQRFDLARIVIGSEDNDLKSIFECGSPKKSSEQVISLQTKRSSVDLATITLDDEQPKKQIDRPKSWSDYGRPVKIQSYNLDDVLFDKKNLKFFKLFATQEFSVENVIFFEEVQNYKSIVDKKFMKERCLEMMRDFFTDDSIHEINTSKKNLLLMKAQIKNESFTPEFFDVVLADLMGNNLSDTFQRFRFSQLYKEMKDKNSRNGYFIFR